MAPNLPAMLPTTTPMMTWVVPLPTAPALAEVALGVSTIGALLLLYAAARALFDAPPDRAPGGHWFRALQA